MNETPQIALPLDPLSALRIRVAELCGWTWGREYNKREAIFIAPKGHGRTPRWSTSDPYNQIIWPYNGRTLQELRIDLIKGLPDYCNDLNACGELIEFLTERGWTCVMGSEYGWACNFRRFGDGVGYKHIGVDDRLSVAICRAFVAVMEASVPSSDAGQKTEQTLGITDAP